MTQPNQPTQGSTADHCTAFPREPHAMNAYLGRSELYVRQCSLCGWIDFADLQQQAEAQQAAGRRQATEGWDREWGVRSPSGGVEVRRDERGARRLASYHEGAQPVSRLVGPWEPAEQATPVDEDGYGSAAVEIFESRSAGWVVRCHPCDITNGGLDEAAARQRAANHVALKHAEQDGDGR